jgi:putative PIN family toxin of toxin-antitoxin system
MRVVFDSNVIVSSFISPYGAPAKVRDAFYQDRFELVVSPPLLAEYRHVLAYPRVASRHGLSPADIDEIVEGFRQVSLVVELADIPNVIPEDPDDDMVVATAVAGSADYIISGDDDLHRLGSFRGIQVLSPAAFLLLLIQ